MAEMVFVSYASQPEQVLFKIPLAVQVVAFSMYHSPKEWVWPDEGNLAITEVSFAVQLLFLQVLVFFQFLLALLYFQQALYSLLKGFRN